MSPCACIGPLHGEEFCHCTMIARGLPLNQVAREEASKRLNAALAQVFGWKSALAGKEEKLVELELPLLSKASQ